MIYKILHTADWHFGRTNHSVIYEKHNSKYLDTLAAFKQLLSIVEKENINICVMSGDIFQMNKPNPAIIAGVTDLLWELEKKVEFGIFISGNHDSSPSTRYNAIEPLKSAFVHTSKFVFLYDKPEVITYKDIHFVCMPHSNELRVSAATTIEDYINSNILNFVTKDKFNIFISHFPLKEATFIKDESSLISDPLELKRIQKTLSNFNLILLGDIHKRQQIETNIFYSGSLIQNTFGEENEEKGVYIFEVDTTDSSIDIINPVIKSREYKTIKLLNFEDHLALDSKNYAGCITKVKLKINSSEKLLNYTTAFQNHFKDSFLVIPDFEIAQESGKSIEGITHYSISEAIAKWIEAKYKDLPDIKLIKERAEQVLSKITTTKKEKENVH